MAMQNVTHAGPNLMAEALPAAQQFSIHARLSGKTGGISAAQQRHGVQERLVQT